MTTTMVTAEQGATTRSEEMVYVPPSREHRASDVGGPLADAGLNAPFVFDFLSAMLAHEMGGLQLYRSVAGRTNNPLLKRQYEEFGSETEHHIEVLESLVGALDGNPKYVSPAARATEKSGTSLIESTFLLSGSLDIMTRELVMLEAVMLAESKDRSNWQTLAAISDELADGDAKTAVARAVGEVLPDEDEHLGWAQDMRTKLVTLQASSEAMATAGAKAEELVETVRGWFS